VRDVLGAEALAQMHFHMSGIAYTERGEQKHLPIDEADLDYRAFLQALVDWDVRGTMACEAPDEHHVTDAQHFQATYRELLAAKAE
jgi:deoxyribonuclease-4